MIIVNLWHGYNLGTPALKPYKREIKTHQNDTFFARKNNMKQDLQRTGKRVRIVNREPGSRINSGLSGF